MRQQFRKDTRESRYSDRLASFQNIMVSEGKDFSNKSQRKRNYRVKQIISKHKTSRIVQNFIFKLKRKSQYGTPVRFYESGLNIYEPSAKIKGFDISQGAYNTIVLFYLISLILLLFISSFSGFLQLFAQQQQNSIEILTLKIIIMIIMTIRFFIKCTNQSYIKGRKTVYIKNIIYAYISSLVFFTDLIAIVLLLLTIVLAKVLVISIILFFYTILQLMLSSDDLVRLEVTYLRTEKKRHFAALFKIFLFNILFAHMMGTFLIGMAQLDRENNWINKAGVDMEGWWNIYIHAFYWATTIMMTVGFGDFLPANSDQVAITAFIEIISCIILSYNISVIGSILHNIRKSDDRVREKMAIFQRILRRGKEKAKAVKKKKLFIPSQINVAEDDDDEQFIDPILEARIFNYIKDLSIDTERLEHAERQQFFQQLPEHLRTNYYKQANSIIFPSVTFFKFLKISTLETLAEHIRSQFHHPGQYIGHQSLDNIYIMESGSVGLAYKRKGSTINGQIMQKIRNDSTLNNILLTNSFLYLAKPHKFDIIAQTYSLTWKIEKQRFFKTLKPSKYDFQYYFNILHKTSLDEDEWEVIECKNCVGKFHTIFDCYRLTYMPIRGSILLKKRVQKSKNQKRFEIQRFKNSHRISALNFRKHFHKIVQLLALKPSKKDNKEEQILNKQKVNSISHQFSQKRARTDHTFASILNEQKLKKIMMQALNEFQTGYSDQFWDLETDKAQNYQFYFPSYNSNKFALSPIKTIFHHFRLKPNTTSIQSILSNN